MVKSKNKRAQKVKREKRVENEPFCKTNGSEVQINLSIEDDSTPQKSATKADLASQDFASPDSGNRRSSRRTTSKSNFPSYILDRMNLHDY